MGRSSCNAGNYSFSFFFSSFIFSMLKIEVEKKKLKNDTGFVHGSEKIIH